MIRATALAVALLSASASLAQPPGAAAMDTADHRATGRFDVQMTPGAAPAEGLARFTMKKTFHGALEGVGTGEMLSAGDPRSGSAGYVAIETVQGKLDGRTGGFALQQSGVMDAGRQELKVTVVPGSGTGELAGIRGAMTIDPAANHAYVLSYRLPPRA